MTDDLLPALALADLVELAQAMIRHNTCNPPGNEQALAVQLADWARAHGLEAEVLPIAPARANLRLRLPGGGQAPALVYCGHLDTIGPGDVPWRHDPFGGAVIDGLLQGRGASDMKGGLAAMLAAMAALRRAGERLPGDLVLLATADEELGMTGAARLAAEGALSGAGWLVIAEPTSLDLVRAHRGVLWLEAVTHGRAAHGSMPHLGVNAILHMTALAQRLSALRLPAAPHPLLPPPTISLNTIAGGQQVNIVPEQCRATIDIRTVPGQVHAQVLETVRSAIAGLAEAIPEFRFDLRVLADRPPVETAPDDPLLDAARRAAEAALGFEPPVRAISYCTDASILLAAGPLPTLLFGPGDERLAHQCDEHVPVEALAAAARFFAALPRAVFAAQAGPPGGGGGGSRSPAPPAPSSA